MSTEEFWEYEWRRHGADEDEPWTRGPRVHTDVEQLEICCGVELGEVYDVRARCVDTLGRASAWTTIEGLDVEGRTAPPAAPTDIRVGPCGVTWNDPNRDVAIAGYRVKHAPGRFEYFDAMEPAHVGIWPGPPFPKCFIPGGARTIAVVAVNTDGIESEPVFSVEDLGPVAPVLTNVVQTIDLADGGFPGTIHGGTGGSTLTAIQDINEFFWPLPRGADLFWAEDDDELFWANDDAEFWNQDIGDDEPFWPVDDEALFWDPRWLPVEYVFTVTPKPNVIDPLVSVDVVADTPGWRLEYRQANDVFWEPDPVPFWNDDDDELFWAQDEGEWRPWPGKIESFTAQATDFRLTVPGGASQSNVTTLKVLVSAEDQLERFENLAIAPSGLRLPIAGKYERVRVESMVLAAGSAGLTPLVLDQDGSRGPLIAIVDANQLAVGGTLAHVTIRGY